jgi:hypothetical protein
MIPVSNSLLNMRSNPEEQPRENGPENESRSGLAGTLAVAGLCLLVWGWVRRFFTGSRAPITVSSVEKPSQKPNRGYEKRDANAIGVFAVVIFLALSGIAIHGILAGFLHSLKNKPAPQDYWRPAPGVPRPESVRAGVPRLQISAPWDLRTFRDFEETQLHTYGWIDRTAGVVRLPIDRAMELVLQEGLPVRAGSNQNRTGPSSYQLIQQRSEHRQPEIQGK